MREVKCIKFGVMGGITLLALSVVGCSKADLGTPAPQLTREQHIRQIEDNPNLSPEAKAAGVRFYNTPPPPLPNGGPVNASPANQ